MAAKRTLTGLIRLLAAAAAVSGLMLASDYHGNVTAGVLPIPGATVTAANAGSKYSTTTDEKGAFSFSGLADGAWTIEVEMLGFAKLVREVKVPATTASGEWELTYLSPEALVAGSSPAGAAKSTPVKPAAKTAATRQAGFQRLGVSQSTTGETTASEGALNQREVADLTPSAANSFLLQGSVSSAAGLPPLNDWGFGGPGGPGGAGGRGFGRGGPDGLGRPGWQRRSGAVAFGNGRRDSGDQYMGNLSFNLNNSIWDAQNYSVTGANLAKPSSATARGTVMFGGPLLIPKLVSRDQHVMFTLNYQFQRSRVGTTSQAVNMPTDLERAGDFSQTLLNGAPVSIYDPLNGAPFPGNMIPASRLSSAATGLLNFFPMPNLPFASRDYETSWNSVSNSQNLNARVMNVSLTGKDRLYGGVGYQGNNSTTPNVFDFIDTGSGRAINVNLGWSHTINARLIHNLRYTFSRNRQLSTPYFAGLQDVAATLGISGTSQDPLNWGPPNLSFTNYAGLTDGNYSLNRNQTSSVGDSLTWLKATHNLTFGGDFRRQQINQLTDPNGRGTLNFNGSATSNLIDGVAQTGTGYDLADFLLGVPTTSSIRFGNPDKYFRGSVYDVFVNDDWRISSRFSLVMGLRWEYATPMSELYNRLVNLDIAPGFVAVAPVEPGQTPVYSGALGNAPIKPDLNNFSPRLGFAWRPFTKDSTVVRGGYGIYYNTSVYGAIAGNMAAQPPFAQVSSVANSTANPLNIATAFLLASGGNASSTYAIDPNYRVGYAQTWTLSVQHNLPAGMFMNIGYLGTKGTRLDQEFLPNSVAPGAAEPLLPHGFIYETSNGDSIYHAAQFQLRRRFRTGISAQAFYTFSKSIDDAGTGGRGQGETPVAQN